jgi:hypothetical protein
MKEDFIIYLWSQRLLNTNLKTQQNEDVTIIKTGQRNLDSGPDFFNSLIKINKQTWAGNVEIHVNASDWDKHKHSNDKVYDNIVLHVVYNDDKIIKRKNGQIIPCLELKNKFNNKILDNYVDFMSARTWIACENLITDISHFDLHNWFDKLTIERLENRSNQNLLELDHNKFDFQKTFYHKLARSYGFNTNSAAFELLAANTPLTILGKHKNSLLQLEAILFGQAGFLNDTFNDEYPNKLKKEYLFLSIKHNLKPIDRKLWKFMRLRPSNFPTIRISQFASFIHKSEGLITRIFETKKINTVIGLFETQASDYWKDHFLFDKLSTKISAKKMGTPSINLLLINTVIPFMFTYGQTNNMNELKDRSLDWMEKIKPESNMIIRNFSKNNIKPSSAFQSQALIQLFNEYCSKQRCLECRIGHKLLSKG